MISQIKDEIGTYSENIRYLKTFDRMKDSILDQITRLNEVSNIFLKSKLMLELSYDYYYLSKIAKMDLTIYKCFKGLKDKRSLFKHTSFIADLTEKEKNISNKFDAIIKSLYQFPSTTYRRMKYLFSEQSRYIENHRLYVEIDILFIACYTLFSDESVHILVSSRDFYVNRLKNINSIYRMDNPKETLRDINKIKKEFENERKMNVKDIQRSLLDLDAISENVDQMLLDYQKHKVGIALYNRIIHFKDDIAQCRQLIMDLKNYNFKLTLIKIKYMDISNSLTIFKNHQATVSYGNSILEDLGIENDKNIDSIVKKINSSSQATI